MSEPHLRRVLIVDDDAAVLRACSLLLDRAGFKVDSASSGARALELLEGNTYSVILSDILMEGMSGLDLLRAIRERDLDTPVVMMTAGPSLATALEAMAYGAHRYLLKPVAPETLVETITRASLLADLARLKREAFALQGAANLPVDDRAKLDAAFTRGLQQLHMVFQPIVSMRQRKTVGFEALVRSTEPEMKNPGIFFDTAGLLGRQPELSKAIYAGVARRAPEIRQELLIFVNVHPPDLLDDSLHGTGSPLAPHSHRIVLEMTERASIDKMGDIAPVVNDLRRLKYRLAVDDLGTGYAGLASFTQLSPEFVKLDRSLVMGIDKHPTKQRVVQAMYHLCADLGMTVISEGVETTEEKEALMALGADYLQGYLFARPNVEIIEPPL
jgi:EAL domain-containing protein (putative c-di-GMP-specific phosphodiesterase class I)/ActR/RegA family two-component response regulator